jgi:integrase
MPRLLTARFVESVKPQPKPVEYGDVSGGRLVVYPTGRKSWVHRYRDASGKPRKDTLGPASGAEALTLSAMRETVARARRQLEQRVAIPRPVPMTASASVASQVAQFLAKHHAAHSRRSTTEAAERAFANIVIPAWGHRALHDIRRRDVIDLLEQVTAERGPYAANRLHAVLSKFFRWLMSRDELTTSPCEGVARNAEKARRRSLSDAELRALLRAADTDHPADCVVRLLALTGTRRNEVATMRFDDLDPKAWTWTIPSEVAKNKIERVVPLSRQAWAVIAAQPQIANCPFVFTAHGRGPVNDWDQTKRRLSQRADIGDDWRLHDLRRTCASGLQRLGVPVPVIESALGHKSGTFAGIVGVYQVHDYAREMRSALQQWGDHVETLLHGRGTRARAAGSR